MAEDHDAIDDVFVPPELPAELLDAYKNVARSPHKFIRLLRIYHKELKKILPFDLNDAQLHLLGLLLTRNRIIVLKARQLGMSTVIRAYIFWQLFIAREPIQWGTLLHHEKAYKAFQRIDDIFLNGLHPLLRRPCTSAVTHYTFLDSGTGHEKFTAGSRTGTRAFVFSAAHLSEFAFYDDQADTLAIVDATVGDGQIVVESTANVPGDLFYELCLGAPGNGWHLCTYWWWQHPPYSAEAPVGFDPTDAEKELDARYGTTLTHSQLQWRRQKIATMGLAKFLREYPGCIEDAFAFGESTWFSTTALDKIATVPWPADAEGDGLELAAYDPDDTYAMGSDVGGGVGANYSTIWITSFRTKQPVYVWRSNRISPLQLADKMVEVAGKWGNPYIVVEHNSFGMVAYNRLLALDYPNIWTRDGKPWNTNVQSKTEMYDLLRGHVDNEIIDQMDVTTMMELRSMQLARETGAPRAPPRMHDDLADGLALSYIGLRDMPHALRPKPPRDIMDYYRRRRPNDLLRGGR